MPPPSDILREYILAVSNGIKQRSDEWYAARKYTIGGSQLAAIQGTSIYSSQNDIIAHKFGYDAPDTRSRLPMHWGILFEDVLKKYIELMKNTEILGDDLFIKGPSDYLSYSPDGLGVVSDEIVLFEFKCPFTRIPTGKPPKYYIPQVKMGLEIIPIANYGILIEAVFRRCSWGDMGINIKFDKKLTDKKSGTGVLASGFVGFYYDDNKFNNNIAELRLRGKDSTADAMIKKLIVINELYGKYFKIGSSSNTYATNDLGSCDAKLFETLMDGFDCGIISVWYSNIIITSDDNVCKLSLNTEFATYECLCTALGEIKPSNTIYNYGIMPWKLFNVKEHKIEKTPDYLSPWIDKINNLMSEVQKCENMSPNTRRKKYDQMTAIQYEIIE